MKDQLKSLEIELYQLENEDCLKFIFKGDFKGNDAEEAVEEWKNLFSSVDEKITLVWDCMEMTGYENKARVLWQHAMKDMKNKIGKVWLVTNSKIIMAGGKLISTFTKFKIKVVKSEEEIIQASKPNFQYSQPQYI